MPNYYGGVQGPAQYAQYQQSRKDQQMQNMLRMFMQMRSLKERRGQWEQDQALQQQKLEFSKKEFESLDRYRQHLAKPKPPTPTEAMKTVEYLVEMGIAPNRKAAYDMYKGFKPEERIEAEATARARGTAKGKPPTQPTITSYDKKKAVLDGKLERKEISPEQYNKSLLGIDPPTSKEDTARKGYPARASNEGFVRATLNNVGDTTKEARKQVKNIPGATPISDSVRIDMPFKYSVAKMNVEDGAATEKDKKIIKDYDEMFQKFQNEILPYFKNFKEFLKANTHLAKDKDWDNIQIRTWFKIYK